MNYKPLMRDDFDKSFKYRKQSFLCYSEKHLREVTGDHGYRIVGLARPSDKETEHMLLLGKHTMAVFPPDKRSLMYSSIGYLPVGEEDEYIAVQESRIPFVICMGSMAAATATVCVTMLATPVPVPNADTNSAEMTPRFNPLPPVDKNLEDYDSASLENIPQRDDEDRPSGGRVIISYRPQADMVLSTGEITMEYQNPGTSTHDAVLQLYVVSGSQEYLIATSGRIPAGKQLKTMELSADKKLFGSEGKYDAEYHVLYYDPETGERTLTEATVQDITLTVRNE